jgi:hypothetical protein
MFRGCEHFGAQMKEGTNLDRLNFAKIVFTAELPFFCFLV